MMLPLANVLQPLIDFTHSILKFFHDQAGFSWGFSIIWLTFVIRLLILPLTFRQVRSMQALQRLQPEMKRIQERYKEDKQRLNQEMMKFYKEHKVNPASACLPVLLQLPFFLALFYMLRKDLRIDVCGKAIEAAGKVVSKTACGSLPGTHGEGFLFIKDVTDKATGAALIALIVLYVGSQLVSGLITTVTADRNQRLLMMALPFVFVTFILSFPAGLIIYWITTNFWTIGQQLFIKRFLPTPEPLPVGGAGLMGGGDGDARPARGKPPAPAAAAAAEEDGKSKPARRRAKPDKAAAAENGGKAQGTGAPPPGPRKKKKRSGRRR